MSDETVFGDLEKLLEHVDTKFTLVNVAMKRARQINNGAPALTDRINPNKPVSTAFNEIGAGKIHYKRVREGIK
jgi:DNA-directed RNA polymerase subunit omega